jgi:hypothetical protein
LLKELLVFSAHNRDSTVNRKKVEKLKSLQAACAQENVSACPLFAEIVSVLGASCSTFSQGGLNLPESDSFLLQS